MNREDRKPDSTPHRIIDPAMADKVAKLLFDILHGTNDPDEYHCCRCFEEIPEFEMAAAYNDAEVSGVVICTTCLDAERSTPDEWEALLKAPVVVIGRGKA